MEMAFTGLLEPIFIGDRIWSSYRPGGIEDSMRFHSRNQQEGIEAYELLKVTEFLEYKPTHTGEQILHFQGRAARPPETWFVGGIKKYYYKE